MVRLVAENTERRRVELESLRSSHEQTNPSRCENASQMTMREQRNVSFHPTQAGDQPVSPAGNLRGRFAVRTAVPIYVPIRPVFVNVCGKQSFVVAIVPL